MVRIEITGSNYVRSTKVKCIYFGPNRESLLNNCVIIPTQCHPNLIRRHMTLLVILFDGCSYLECASGISAVDIVQDFQVSRTFSCKSIYLFARVILQYQAADVK